MSHSGDFSDSGDQHHLVRLLAAGDLHGDPSPRPEAHLASVSVHVSRGGGDGHDVSKALREFTTIPLLKSTS